MPPFPESFSRYRQHKTPARTRVTRRQDAPQARGGYVFRDYNHHTTSTMFPDGRCYHPMIQSPVLLWQHIRRRLRWFNFTGSEPPLRSAGSIFRSASNCENIPAGQRTLSGSAG
ncbi:hypothetical protein KCP71_11740 [Salmonella enterica subsp. enterica]|nr:hypothetical protein KCP71_11740 [Salmonella enterica subsp. enterica]